MSDNNGPLNIQKCIDRLRKQSEPNSNDKRHAQYARYINTFLSYFGDERVYLVGSTGENQKLRWSKDGGDADFILRSGKLKIPVDCIVHRQDTPCFVWINCKNIDLTKVRIEPIEGEFLPSSSLRKVDPELFTIARAIYTVVTSTSDSIEGTDTRVVTTGIVSKVGLARSEYKCLEIVQKDFNPNLRSKPLRNQIKKPERSDEINAKDMFQLETILKIIAEQKLPGSSSNNAGRGMLNWAHTVSEVMKRRQFRAAVTDEGEAQIYDNDLDEEEDLPPKETNTDQNTCLPEKVTIQYSEKSSKDFVPALLIVGKLACMNDWMERQLKSGWLGEDVVNEIYNSDVFVVSKYAPVNPDTSKDFCLSFNLAEVKLASCLTEAQRDAMLILKSYLKGIFRKYHERAMVDVDEKHDLKLTTFHLKTALYWLCEEKKKGWTENTSALQIVDDVLEFLAKAAGNMFLLHYFTESNLFAGFQEIDFNIIIGCIADIREDLVGNICDFFSLDDGQPVFTDIPLEEAICISNMSADGGKEQQMDSIEDAMIDFQRGCNASHRDSGGNAPILKACKGMVQKMIEDDSEISRKTQLAAAVLGICSDDVIQCVSNFLSRSPQQRENDRKELDKIKYMLKGFKF